MNAADRSPLDDSAARAVLLVRAADRDDEAGRALWTPEDRAWASRAARQSLPADASPQALLVERARHAADRLRGRDAALARWLDAAPAAATRGMGVALGLGAAVGLVVDHIGPSQQIHLLAPPVWAVVLWNLAVLLSIPFTAFGGAVPSGPRAWLGRWLARTGSAGPVAARLIASAEADRANRHAARAALLLHAAAAALGLGLVAGLYLRGLVLDYRVGWQSTFLEPGTVHAVLSTLLSPASLLCGLPVPDAAAVAALRVGPHDAPSGAAAVWIHLYAATVAAAVVLPRTLLAIGAAGRLSALQRDAALPWEAPDLRELARQLAGGPPQAWVLPHVRAPAQALPHALAEALLAASGEAVPVQWAAPLPWGSEADAPLPLPPPGATQAWLCVDAAATPEAEVQGVLLQRLRAATPAVAWGLLVDEQAYAARVGPARAAQRRAAWQQLADAHRVRLLAPALR